MLDISSLSPTQLSDSAELIDATTHFISSPFARLVVTTEATTLRLTTYNDIKTDYADLTKFGVTVDGEFFASLNPAAEGSADFYIGLDKGQKTVEFVAAPQSKPTDLIGGYLASVTANKPMTQVLSAETERLLIYGDSIAVGDGCGTAVQAAAWPLLLRQDFAGSVALEAWGYRSLANDGASASARNAFVAKVVARSPTILWMAIGTNDYGLHPWAAAAFGAAYADLLDKLHAALPDVAIYCQSPILRETETANADGSTMGDYRTEIETACSTRAWATFVDGTAFLETTDLADGVHPNADGHALVASAVLTALT